LSYGGVFGIIHEMVYLARLKGCKVESKYLFPKDLS